MSKDSVFRSGFITIAGRPNVGKSTLLNALVGEKVAIVSPKPQTTRNRILGVMDGENFQIVFVDTPGIHKPRTRLGEYMEKSVRDAMEGMDGLLAMADATALGEKDMEVLTSLSSHKCPKILALNKVDLIDKKALLPLLQKLQALPFDAVIPLSARTGDGLDILKDEIMKFLPEGPRYFPADMPTDQPERLLCGEMIREKALQHLRDEVPHGIGVEMMGIQKLSSDFVQIDATIYCEKDSHKGIIIGKHGSMLTLIGREAREDIEKLLGSRVNLKLFVKVRPGWRDSADDLKTLGYE